MSISVNDIRIGTYGKYASSNYGINAMKVDVGPLTLYFSYRTLVAVRHPNGLTVRQNDWRATTGKHLNWIDGGDKKSRLPCEDFQREVAQIMTECGTWLGRQ
jgi:hypothetical protein